MEQQRDSFKPLAGARRSLRKRLDVRNEFVLAAFPTLTVLAMLAILEALTHQRLLFASLASSAFLIYLDPEHGTNRIRTLIIAHLAAAAIGLLLFSLLGPGYLSGGSAMVATIVLMIVFDAVHPPAIGTSLIFAFRPGEESNLLLFSLAVLITVLLVILERLALWLLARQINR